MADNIELNSGTGGSVLSTDEVTRATVVQHVQYVKLMNGTDAAIDVIPGDATNGLLVNLGGNNDVTVTGTVTANIAAGTNNIGDVDVLSVIPGTGATNLGKAVDSAAGATDTGVALLAVRDDVLAALTPVDGDYVPLRVSSTGALHVTGGGGGTEYNEDEATPLTITGTATMMERDDALAALTPIEGDWAAMRCNANGALWTAVNGTVTVDGSGVTQPVSGTVTVTATNLDVRDLTSASDSVAAVCTNAGTFAVQAAVDELPAAAALSDNFANPTTTQVGAMGMVWDGVTWDRAPGTAADGLTVNLGANNDVTVTGTVTANLAAGTNNIGDVDILSIAAGDNNIGNVDIVTMPNVTLAAGTNTNEVVGDAAHDAAIAGNPVRIGARAVTADYTSVATGDTADLIATVGGKLIIHPYAIPENLVKGATSDITTTTSTSVVAAAGAGLKNYITDLLVQNSHATVGTWVNIQDGSGGATLYTVYAAPAGGGAAPSLRCPIATTANTALHAACVTTGANVRVSASGYKAP